MCCGRLEHVKKERVGADPVQDTLGSDYQTSAGEVSEVETQRDVNSVVPPARGPLTGHRGRTLRLTHDGRESSGLREADRGRLIASPDTSRASVRASRFTRVSRAIRVTIAEQVDRGSTSIRQAVRAFTTAFQYQLGGEGQAPGSYRWRAVAGAAGLKLRETSPEGTPCPIRPEDGKVEASPNQHSVCWHLSRRMM